MKFERSSGILFHPTSLPGPYGIGDIGPQAYKWIDFLAETGCSLWQVLPLGPTGYGDSPYQCFSAFAGNPFLISPEALMEEKLLFPDDFTDLPKFPTDRVDFGWVIPWKLAILDKAFDRFKSQPFPALRAELDVFCAQHADWLEDYALFMALKEAHGGAPWPTWEAELRSRQPQALEQARRNLAESVERQTFRQFLFYRQWKKLRNYAKSKGIQIIGDIPIFVAHDSSDVWSHPELFYLDEAGKPTYVAGVPPDYFSATGQLWGNPLYRWNVHRETQFGWWIERIRAVLELVDVIRLDHFRGFAGYWRVPGSAKTAEKGRWVKAPGKAFLTAVKNALGELPLIAEDLGVITPDVTELRDSFGLPGMRVIQFAFGGFTEDIFLPHNFVPNCISYTGTHDNDTTRGWYEKMGENERHFYRRYLDRDDKQVVWDLIRLTWMSVAVFALAPMQDFLNLGNEARMNYPGNPSGNWSWRMPVGAITPELKLRLKDINYLYDRKIRK